MLFRSLVLLCILICRHPAFSKPKVIWKPVGTSVKFLCPFAQDDDEPNLIVLFKGTHSKDTIFSYDARSKPFSSGTSWFNTSLVGERASFNLTDTEAIIVIRNLTEGDHGLYQCRIVYGLRPPSTYKTDLKMTVGIKSVRIHNNTPLTAGRTIKLLCAASGPGRLTAITWYNDKGERLNASKSVLDANNITRSMLAFDVRSEDHLKNITCKAYHQKLPKVMLKENATIHILGAVTVPPSSKNFTKGPQGCEAWEDTEEVCVRCEDSSVDGAPRKYNMEVVDEKGQFVTSMTRDFPSWSFKISSQTNLTIRINSFTDNGSSQVVILDFYVPPSELLTNTSAEMVKIATSKVNIAVYAVVGVVFCIMLPTTAVLIRRWMRRKSASGNAPDVVASVERRGKDASERVNLQEQNTTGEGAREVQPAKYVAMWKATAAQSKQDGGRKRFYTEADV